MTLKSVPKLNLNIPDHTILDKIGDGGMSTVYLGRQISLQRKVAIKVLNKLVVDDKTLAERFVDEAKTVALLDHPHIISIYEAKKLPSGLAYFTMPYLTHGDFSEIICTNADHLIDLLGQICDGLSHAHKHHVIHRDLKPENILFDQFGRIKIADFGIAISKRSKRKTKETQLLGSAHYMSPEQIQSKEIDHRSDIYSLGCIIYEKITGDHVFEGGNDFSILMAHINKPTPQLPEELQVWQPIIEKCLNKDPESRYQSVDELKSALMQIKYTESKPEPAPKRQVAGGGFDKRWIYGGAGALAFIAVATVFLSKQAGEEPNTNLAENSNEPTPVQQVEKQAEPKNDLENLTAQVPPTTTQQPSQPLDDLVDEPEPPAIDFDDLAQIDNDPAFDEADLANADSDTPLELTIGVIDNSGDEDVEQVDITGNLDNATITEMSVEVALKEGNDLLKKYRLTKPKGENAADKFQSILMAHPDHKEARRGLNRIGLLYFSLINNRLKKQEFDAALKHASSLAQYFKDYDVNQKLFQKQTDQLLNLAKQSANDAIKTRRPNTQTRDILLLAQVLEPSNNEINGLKAGYDQIWQTGHMIDDQKGHKFVYFAVNGQAGVSDMLVGQTEVTVGQFRQFAGQTAPSLKCHHYGKKGIFKKTWLKPPFDQNNQHPVICITQTQAKQYAKWLSDQTGHDYRLLTQAEWAYLNQLAKPNQSCQAGNNAAMETKSESKATNTRLSCSDQHVFTAPVKQYTAQSGLSDFQGNVSEWLDCAGCAGGNSWRSGANQHNSQVNKLDPAATHSQVGFRLVREL